MTKHKLVRITTVPISLEKLLSGQLHYMRSFYDVIAVSADKENLEKLGKSQEVEVFPVEMTRKITPAQDFFAIIKLYSFLRKTKPFIVHTHTPKAGLVGMIAAKLAGVPHRLHTVAGLPLVETIGLKRKLLDFVEKVTYSCATRVYPNSLGLKYIIEKNNYCGIQKLKVLANGSSNGIDTAYFNPDLFSTEHKTEFRNSLGIPEDDFVFVFVGRLVSAKGINEMIVAFELLQKKHSQVKLLLVGDYEKDLDPLSAFTLERIKSNTSILSVGFQSDVRPYFSISDALVFPSYREGFPNVVMQAGAMGLPSIVSDINGCNEIIIEGENGLIISVKSSQALYDAMELFLSDNQLFKIMKQNARSLIVSRYEQLLVWEAILQEYRLLD